MESYIILIDNEQIKSVNQNFVFTVKVKQTSFPLWTQPFYRKHFDKHGIIMKTKQFKFTRHFVINKGGESRITISSKNLHQSEDPFSSELLKGFSPTKLDSPRRKSRWSMKVTKKSLAVPTPLLNLHTILAYVGAEE